LLTRWVVAAAVFVLAVGFTIIWCAHAGLAKSEPSPKAAASQAAAVGALFTLGPGDQLGGHFCTASVVASPSGDLILTAAHCISGHSAGTVAFVPGFSGGREPYGVWIVTQVFVDHNWQSSLDPDDDFALLTVSRPGSKQRLQDLTGAETIGINVLAGAPVTVDGYPSSQNTQISCKNIALAFSPTQFQFDCGGYYDGTSGGPFLIGVSSGTGLGTVIGVIGGYEQGGDTPSVSYAARFGTNMAALYQTAAAASAP
jgi:V8-like Glu-specific endopeptidase